MGFPTVNMSIPKEADIEYGIYAGWIKVDSQRYMAAIHFGPVPTFSEKNVSLEAYLLDAPENFELIYGKTVFIEFISKIRDIIFFSDTRSLVLQIQKDIEAVRNRLTAQVA